MATSTRLVRLLPGTNVLLLLLAEDDLDKVGEAVT
jgi:hypothetical protein